MEQDNNIQYSNFNNINSLLTEKEIFQAICTQSPDSLPVFMQCWWLDAVCDRWDVAVTFKGEQVTGVWPYIIEEKAGLSFRRNPRLTPYLGPRIFYPVDIKETNKDSHEHEVIEQLMSKMPEADIWGLSQYPGMKQAGLFRHYGFRIDVQQTFILSLEEDEQTLYQNFKEQLRRNIRAAEKETSITADESCLPELYEFQKAALFQKRVAQSHTLADMEKLMRACQDHKSSALWVARQEGVVQGLVWNVWDAETSYYIMGAKNPAAEDYRAMSALLWHAILEAKKRGNKYFDFEGSMDPGVERFFRNFGGRRELYLILRKEKHWLWRLKKLVRK